MQIIILSGKAESGKNKVASIIEENLKDKKVITISYAFYLKEYAKKILKWDGLEDTKPRTFLQEIGDYVKEIDKNFLINRLLQDIEVYKKYFVSNPARSCVAVAELPKNVLVEIDTIAEV